MRGLLGILLLIASLPLAALAMGRKDIFVTPVARDEGNLPIPFNASCISTGWTVVVSSQPVRHSLTIQSSLYNSDYICVLPSTSTLPGSPACGSTSKGVELNEGGSLTDYGTGQWVCESKSGTQYLKGYWQMDTGDRGGLPNGY